jgi:hypothetical protein
MKYLLITAAVLGLIYVVFMDTNKSVDHPGGLPEKTIYQQEIEKAKAVEVFLQETVDQRLDEMDQAK